MVQGATDKFYEAGAAFFGAGAIASAAAVTLAATTGLILMTAVAAPGITSRCSAALRRRGVLSLVAGAGVFVVLALFGALVAKAKFLGLPWLVATVVPTVVGLTAVSEDVGRRLFGLCGRESNRAAYLVSGWVVGLSASIIPFLGWFVIGPVLVLSGLGSCVVGFFPASDALPPKAAAGLQA